MTGAFDPTKLSIIECLLVHSKFSSHPLIKTADKATQVSYSVQRAINPALDLGELIIFIRLEVRLLHEVGYPVAEHESVFRVVFKIENFEELIELDENGVLTQINDNLIIAATSIATSTIRGAVLPLYSNTFLHKFLMPTIPIAEIAAMDYFGLSEYIPDWAGQAGTESSGDLEDNETDRG